MKIRSLSIGLLLVSLMFSALPQAAVELKEDVPETYIVKKGDTLWGISGMYLREPWLWPELWDVNPQIDNPHLIYPGDELYLVWVDGQPRLRMRRGRDVKLTPSMRVNPLDLAIPVIPLDQIGASCCVTAFWTPTTSITRPMSPVLSLPEFRFTYC